MKVDWPLAAKLFFGVIACFIVIAASILTPLLVLAAFVQFGPITAVPVVLGVAVAIAAGNAVRFK